MNDTASILSNPAAGFDGATLRPWFITRAYAAMVLLPIALAVIVIASGSARLHPTSGAVVTRAQGLVVSAPLDIGVLLIQIAVILGLARLCGALMVQLRQPRVIGEILGGIILGPTVLAPIAPGVSAMLFPTGSLAFADALAQFGMVLFMFVLGSELDLTQLRQRAHVAFIASHAGISVPFLLGAMLSLAIFVRFAPPGIPFAPFALFVGVAMSVTAFPVLARILQDRGMADTPLGTTALLSAAVADVSAWSILALASSLAQAAGIQSLLVSIGGALLYIVPMLVVGQCLRAWLKWRPKDDTDECAIGMVLIALGSAFLTERLGIHFIFGAFFAGTVVPRAAFSVHKLTGQLRGLTAVFFLPIYFAMSGLRTSLALISGMESFIVCFAIILIAIVGKLGGTAIAGRIIGLDRRDALSLGVLMNTRGLMELVILNIGLDMGVLTPKLFAMLVLMALLTTAMTMPLLDALGTGRHLRAEVA